MKKILVFIVLICGATSAAAWDDTGHKVSAEIAWRQMTPAARERAIAVLMNAPENSGILNLMPNDTRSLAARQEQMFYTMATWADLLRDSKYFPIRNKEYHHGTWHYLDAFWREQNGKIEFLTEMNSNEKNAVERLFAFEKTLSDVNAAAADKAVALAWILHLAGDIHQPLHCSARVTTEEPKGDQGGNLFLLTPAEPKEKRENLHWYWDSILSRSVPRVNDEPDSIYIAKLADKLMKKYAAKDFAAKIKPSKYDEWHKEGIALATTEVYPPTLKRGEMPSEKYRQRAQEIAEEKLSLAGYRIAELLNRILG
jgi:hypothetical protein